MQEKVAEKTEERENTRLWSKILFSGILSLRLFSVK